MTFSLLVPMYRGPDALIVRLQKAGIEDPTQYVTFHGLRTHSELNGDLVSTIILQIEKFYS